MAAASTSFSVARRIQLNDPFPFFAGDPKTSSDTATRAPPSPSTHTHTLVAARWRREEWREVAVKLFYFELKVITFRTRRACQFFFFLVCQIVADAAIEMPRAGFCLFLSRDLEWRH